MISDLERQRVTQYQQQRERYLHARRKEIQPTLAADQHLLTTRYRFLPIVLVAPFAILAVAGALDLLSLLTGNSFWTSLSFAMIGPGVIGSVAALAVGLHDWFAAPAGSRVRGVGVWFAIGTALVVTVFAQSWVARFDVTGEPGGLGVILGFMGASVALLTGWLLGEYLDRLSAIPSAATRPSAPATHRDAAQPPVEELVEERKVAHA